MTLSTLLQRVGLFYDAEASMLSVIGTTFAACSNAAAVTLTFSMAPCILDLAIVPECYGASNRTLPGVADAQFSHVIVSGADE